MPLPEYNPPSGFGSPESRKMVADWLSGETTGEPVSGEPNIRRLNRDPQRLLYVAILKTQTLDNENKNKRTSKSAKHSTGANGTR